MAVGIENMNRNWRLGLRSAHATTVIATHIRHMADRPMMSPVAKRREARLSTVAGPTTKPDEPATEGFAIRVKGIVVAGYRFAAK
jgi:hypothetical protein